jgi:hypothetical protein
MILAAHVLLCVLIANPANCCCCCCWCIAGLSQRQVAAAPSQHSLIRSSVYLTPSQPHARCRAPLATWQARSPCKTQPQHPQPSLQSQLLYQASRRQLYQSPTAIQPTWQPRGRRAASLTLQIPQRQPPAVLRHLLQLWVPLQLPRHQPPALTTKRQLRLTLEGRLQLQMFWICRH